MYKILSYIFSKNHKIFYSNILILIYFISNISCSKKLLLKENSNYNENSKFIKMIGKFKLKRENGKNLKAKFQIRIKKNKLIWISISAVLGIEILRLQITKIGVTIINKHEKTYTYYTFDELKEKIGFKLNLKIIQKIILAKKRITKGEFYNKQIGNPFIIETIRNNNIITIIDERSKRVKKILLQNDKKINGVTVEYEYKDPNYRLPYDNMRIDIFKNGKNLDIFNMKVRNLKTITSNNPLDFPFDIPENYEIV